LSTLGALDLQAIMKASYAAETTELCGRERLKTYRTGKCGIVYLVCREKRKSTGNLET
jgi:hypothetical protein